MNQTIRKVQLFNLGRLDYPKSFNIQKYLVNEKLKDAQQPDTLLLVEHDPTYTIGLRRSAYKSAELDRLRSLNARVEFIDRGGLITFHGPGQLVAYPILNLKWYNASLKWYVSRLEQIVIDLVARREFGLAAHRLCSLGYTGVWVGEKKIAAIGVHCKRYMTYHGLAVNCDVDLGWFRHIVPCGIEDKEVGSLSEILNRRVGVREVEQMFAECFEKTFNVILELKSTEETQDLINKAQHFHK